MARKKAEIQLLREIETQEEWEEVMAMEGLWVVDVYQEWCGPCQALVGSFRRLKNELGDPLLNFAMAKADTIDALEKYRGRCEPTFLFFAGQHRFLEKTYRGQSCRTSSAVLSALPQGHRGDVDNCSLWGILTSYIHGADAPKVQKVITEQLASEHKILEGAGERKEVKDPVITRAEEIEMEKLAEMEILKAIEERKGVTVAIIKPDAIAQGKLEEIIAEMKENEMEILAQEERELTTNEAKKLYANLSDETYYEELIRFMTSGPSYVMLLTRGDTGMTVVKDWKNLIGPNNVEQAKEEAPNSLRARYGEKSYLNAVHGSSSKETAAKELIMFFPSYNVPTYQKKKENIQITLALIRPEAFASKKNAIMQKIMEVGFKIVMYKEVQLSKEQAAEFYKEHEQYAYFDSLVENMCSGPILALGLAGDEAIKNWKKALGPSNIDEAMEKAPQSLRAQFPGTSGMNQMHGSDSEEAAKDELAYFFPMEQTVAVIKPDGMTIKDEILLKIQEAGFRIAAQQEITLTSNIVDILYPNQRDQSYYEDIINFMTSAPILIMILTREGAVNGWRLEMGDVDPDAARNSNPECLRALFGKNLIRNAVHGSSNPGHVKREMQAVFGDLKFNEDGTVKGAQPNLEEAKHVIQRDTSSDDAGDDVPEFNASESKEDAIDTEHNVLAEEAQDTADETNNAEAELVQQTDAPEGNTQTDTPESDTVANVDNKEPTQGTPIPDASDNGSHEIEGEKQEDRHEETDKDSQQIEQDQETDEPQAAIDRSEKIQTDEQEVGSPKEADSSSHTQEETASMLLENPEEAQVETGSVHGANEADA